MRDLMMMILLALAGCSSAPLDMPPADGGAAVDLAPAADLAECRMDRLNWIQNDGGPACCGVAGGRCCAGANPCDPGLRCVLNYTSTCVADFLDGGA